MAEGFLKSFDKDLEVHSAGTEPAGQVNQMAVKVMSEAGIDISRNKPENIAKYLNDSWDYVITVCDSANESCPFFSGNVTRRLHIGFKDPSDETGNKEHILNEFRKVRDEIRGEFFKFYQNTIQNDKK
jgi:arsenate reductase (thioredoxin)